MTDINDLLVGFDPNWTAQEALSAGSDGPLSPFHRWAAWGMLDEDKKKFEEGQHNALLAAIATCATHRLPMPDWLAKAYLRGFHEWVNYRSASLDDAFGVQIPKGKHINKLRKMRLLRVAIPQTVDELRNQASGRRSRPIDISLFNDVGAMFNISGSAASKIYYQTRGNKKLHEKP